MVSLESIHLEIIKPCLSLCRPAHGSEAPISRHTIPPLRVEDIQTSKEVVADCFASRCFDCRCTSRYIPDEALVLRGPWVCNSNPAHSTRFTESQAKSLMRLHVLAVVLLSHFPPPPPTTFLCVSASRRRRILTLLPLCASQIGPNDTGCMDLKELRCLIS
jgi:hypothetical protein